MANNIVVDTTWIRNRFNLQYNNIFSNQAPGLVDYEISMYLTMAHIEIIDQYSDSVDLFEKYRSILTGYIYEESINGVKSNLSTRGIDYQLFQYSENYWRILKEYIITNSNELGMPVKPISYDSFNSMSSNPFKKPNGFKAWRLDINYDPDANEKRDVKILFKKMDANDYIKKYNVVYLTTPEKFDLENDIVPATLTNNPYLAEKITNRAVELATRDYKENSLQSQIQINKRSE